MAKESEQDFRNMCKRLNIWAHKWADLRVCPKCHTKLFASREDVPDESIIDYEIFIGSTPAWVECKGKPGHTLLPFTEISPKQRNFLTSWMLRDVWSFLFVTLGDGNAPRGRQAWLIPWYIYTQAEDHYGTARVSWPWKQQGVYPGFNQVFWEYELTWVKGGWTIPPTSPMLGYFPDILTLPSLYGVDYGHTTNS